MDRSFTSKSRGGFPRRRNRTLFPLSTQRLCCGRMVARVLRKQGNAKTFLCREIWRWRGNAGGRSGAPLGPRAARGAGANVRIERRRNGVSRARTRSPARRDRVQLDRAEAGEGAADRGDRSEEHTSELQSQFHLVCRLL